MTEPINQYVGDGVTVLYPFTFEYLEPSDIYVSVDTQLNTDWSLTSATEITFNTAPAVDVKINIFRITDLDSMSAVFGAASTIRARDLNDDFNQLRLAIQEKLDSSIVINEGNVSQIVAGDNISVSPTNGKGTVTITAAATPYNLPIASASVLGGIKVGANLSISGSGVLSATGGGGGGGIVFKGTADFTSTAPSNPDVGDLYLNDTAGTGAWAGFNDVAVGIDDRAFFNGADWDRLPSGGGGEVLWEEDGTKLYPKDLTQSVGIGGTADEPNHKIEANGSETWGNTTYVSAGAGGAYLNPNSDGGTFFIYKTVQAGGDSSQNSFLRCYSAADLSTGKTEKIRLSSDGTAMFKGKITASSFDLEALPALP